MRFLLMSVFIFLLSSCNLVDRLDYSYPGDRFSRTLASAKCEKVDVGTYHYFVGEGITLHLNGEQSYFVDKRDSDSKKVLLSNLHYNDKIDSSLRYFIRESMSVKELKGLFGNSHEKWGGIASAMMVWPMADGRYLAILPSALQMPEGMNSYNILNQHRKLYRNVRLLKLGEELN